MSRIDTTSFAQSYLGGAQLGTSQFGMLANIMQAMARQGLAERQFTADEMQRETSNSLNERQFGRQLENDVFDQGMREDNYRLDLGNQDISRSNLALRQGEFDLRTREDARREERRKLTSKVYATMARSILDKTAANRAMVQAGPSYSPTQGPATQPGGTVGSAPMQQLGPMAPPSNPEDDKWRDMIDSLEWSGDFEALGQIMPMLADERERSDYMATLQLLTHDGAVAESIPDDTPRNRAMKSLLGNYQKVGNPEWLMEKWGKWLDQSGQLSVSPEIATKFGLPSSMVGRPYDASMSRLVDDMRAQEAAQRVKPAKVMQPAPGVLTVYEAGRQDAPIRVSVLKGAGQPLIWDETDPVVAQFMDAAEIQEKSRYTSNWHTDETREAYKARTEKTAKQFAASMGWNVDGVRAAPAAPGGPPAGAPRSNEQAAAVQGPGPGGAVPAATEQDLRSAIAKLKAQGVTDPTQIKAKLAEMGLVR